MRYGFTLLAVAGLFGCRADGGPDDYDSQEHFADAAPPPIPSVLEEGEQRFSLGLYYEGPADQGVVVDGVQANFYIYEGTFSSRPDEGDRVEGAVSERITHAGGGWWGGGVHLSQGQDLSLWPTLRVSLKSSDASFESLELAMADPDDVRGVVAVADYGFEADGAWHDLEIPLEDFEDAGADLTNVGAPFIFVGGAGEAGDTLLVDALYLTTVE